MWKLFSFVTISAIIISKTAQADVAVDYNWTRVETEVSPRPGTYRTHASSGFELSGDKIIVSSHERNQRYTTTGKIGDALETVNDAGLHIIAKYKFKNNEITETLKFPYFTITTTIVTNGTEYCNATTTYHKLPGQKKFYIGKRTSNGETMYISDEHAEEETCRVLNLHK